MDKQDNPQNQSKTQWLRQKSQHSPQTELQFQPTAIHFPDIGWIYSMDIKLNPSHRVLFRFVFLEYILP
jgi:hypothetical protein